MELLSKIILIDKRPELKDSNPNRAANYVPPIDYSHSKLWGTQIRNT